MKLLATIAILAALAANSITLCAPVLSSRAGAATLDTTARSMTSADTFFAVEGRDVDEVDPDVLHRRGVADGVGKALESIADGASTSATRSTPGKTNVVPAWDVLFQADYKPRTEPSPAVKEALSVMKEFRHKLASDGPVTIKDLPTDEQKRYRNMSVRLSRFLQKENTGVQVPKPKVSPHMPAIKSDKRWMSGLSQAIRDKLKMSSGDKYNLLDLSPGELRQFRKAYEKKQKRLRMERIAPYQDTHSTPEAVNGAIQQFLGPIQSSKHAPNPTTSASQVRSSRPGPSTPPGSDALPGTPQQPSIKLMHSFDLNEVWVEPTQSHERSTDFPSSKKQAN